jgi:alkylation response protein AidB-like acyl-CoA dehydrogenase
MLTLPKHEPDIYEQIGAMARRFADEAIRPVAEALDREERFPGELYERMGELGLFGISAPEEHGGVGLDALAYAIVMEELSRGYASVADQCGLVELISTLLSRYGTEAQRAEIMEPMLRARMRVAYCITEAEAGSDVSGIKTTAPRRRGLGAERRQALDPQCARGRPRLRAGAHRPGGGPSRHVDLHRRPAREGRHARAERAQDGPARVSQVGGLSFENVKLGPEALLGREGRGFHMMMSVLEKGRVGIAALAVGIAQAGLEAALDYAQTRKQFGRPIAENQGLQWMLADMAKEVTAARALTHRAAMTLDAGKPANAACSMAKLYAGDMAVAQTANAVQIFGGSGYILGFEVERLYRDAKITQIYEGTQQIQRTVIARELLKNGAAA